MSNLGRFEGYTFHDRLGTGTYATVYKAKDREGQTFAIKCIKKKSLSQTGADNLITEIRVLKELRHRHIVQLFDFNYDKDQIYLVLEYCNVGDLSSLISFYGKLSESMVKDISQQLALALRYMHKKQVAHLDLKPQNILLTGSKKEPKIKVADFGFAKILKSSTSSKDASLRGSLLYMAPEIILSRTNYDENLADMWSVGVIIFECLCGRAPFASRTYDELLIKISDSTPVEVKEALPKGTGGSCVSLVSKLLERNPKYRLCFTKFYNHPFLDMEHAPTPSSLPTARDLVEQAVNRDTAGDYEDAVHYYTASLNHFMAAIQYEESQERKDALRMKVKKYMSRAEELKHLLRDGRPRVASNEELIPCQQLMQLSAQNHALKRALAKLQIALEKDEKGEYGIALGLYENALEALLAVHKSSGGRVKELLSKEINKHMKRAEEIKSFQRAAKKTDGYSFSSLSRTCSTATQSTPTIENMPKRPHTAPPDRTIKRDPNKRRLPSESPGSDEEETTYQCTLM